MYSCVVCSEAEPAFSAAILRGWKTARVSRIRACSQDEGQFLQDVYPTDAAYGGAGRFGFDPRAHRTETSELLTPENVAKTSRKLACLLGQQQNNLRGENAGEPSHDPVFASSVSQLATS